MRQRLIILIACTCLTIPLGGCGVLGRSPARPTVARVQVLLPKGTTVNEVAYADLSGDGREEVYVTATMPAPGSQLTAIVLAPDRRSPLTPVVQRIVAGDTWLPILVGQPGEGAPQIVVFAARAATTGQLGYVVVQYHKGFLQVMLERSGILSGRIRFVPEGLLESKGDTDRIYRWAETTWQAEDLGSQYLPPLPANTVTIQYTIDQVRGPFVEGSRSLRMRVGQYLFFRRMDRGEASRLLFTQGVTLLRMGMDGVILLAQPGEAEVSIEGPAYSGRTATISVRIDQ